MPELIMFGLGAFVTAVAVVACVLVGRAEDEDARVGASEPVER